MPYLLDTNILVRWASPDDPAHPIVLQALERLHAKGEPLYVCEQVLTEFWHVATKDVSRNGLGLSIADTSVMEGSIRGFFSWLSPSDKVYGAWLALVRSYGIRSRQVYDARIAAFAVAHGITHVLTANVDHFRVFQSITAVHPADVAANNETAS